MHQLHDLFANESPVILIRIQESSPPVQLQHVTIDTMMPVDTSHQCSTTPFALLYRCGMAALA